MVEHTAENRGVDSSILSLGIKNFIEKFDPPAGGEKFFVIKTLPRTNLQKTPFS